MRTTFFLLITLMSQVVFASSSDNLPTNTERLEIAARLLTKANVSYSELALAQENRSDFWGKLLIKGYHLIVPEEVGNDEVTPITFLDSGIKTRCILFINTMEKTAAVTSCEVIQQSDISVRSSL